MKASLWKYRSQLVLVLFSLILGACAVGGGDIGTGLFGGGDEGTGKTADSEIVRSHNGALISLPALQINDIHPPHWLRGNWKLNQTQAREFTAQFNDTGILFENGFARLTFGKDNASIEVTQHDDTSFTWKIDYQSNGQPVTISYGCTRVDNNNLVCSYSTVDNIQVHFMMTRVF